MRKLLLVLILMIFIFNVSALKITEFESNPPGTDSGNEWIELYNDGEVNLEEYKLINNDGGEVSLNGTISDYFVYIFEKQWLDNTDEKVFLYKNGELIDETDIFDDSTNSDSTWQLCDDWEFKISTKGEENSCGEASQEGTSKESSESQQEENAIEEKDESKKEKSEQSKERETIVLNPQVIKSEDDNENLSKSNYTIYGLVFFCVLLVVLFILRKNKYNKNEFR